MSGNDFLVDWAHHYAQHLSVFRGDDEKVTRQGEVVHVKGSKSTTKYIPASELSDYQHKTPSNGETIYVVTFNTKDNLESLEKQWKKFSEHRNVIVIFLNPKSKLDKKWSIHPYVHNMICDEKALHTGLKSLTENVEQIKKADIEGLKE